LVSNESSVNECSRDKWRTPICIYI
jgi:hypothetical protein